MVAAHVALARLARADEEIVHEREQAREVLKQQMAVLSIRAAEKILYTAVGGPGRIIPNNTHFDTTRANVEFTGAEALDLVIAEGRQPALLHPFKGNMDIGALERLLEARGADWRSPGRPVLRAFLAHLSVGHARTSVAQRLAAIRSFHEDRSPFGPRAGLIRHHT